MGDMDILGKAVQRIAQHGERELAKLAQDRKMEIACMWSHSHGCLMMIKC